MATLLDNLSQPAERFAQAASALGGREAARGRRWFAAAFPAEPPRPAWATPHERYPVADTVALCVFGAPAAAPRLPVLVVTPQVNHSYIADFSERQSLVRTLLAAGAGPVGVTDWLDPPRDRAYAIVDSLDDIERCMARLGERVHLVGLCQGGWQAAMIAALRPEAVASLTCAAAPIDTHAGTTVLHSFTFGLPYGAFELLVAAHGGVAPGRALGQGFDLLKPFERFFFNYLTLYHHADRPEFVERYQELRNWYRLNKDLAGALYLEAVRALFMENQLARGEYRVRGQRVDLSVLRCPLHLLAGSRDHITPPEQVHALARLAPHAPSRTYLVDAGHIGVFMGQRALQTVWPGIAASY